jgi:hypothetical protein
MIRLYYDQEGTIIWAVTDHAAPNYPLPYIKHEDDNIKINEWAIDPVSKNLIPQITTNVFSRFSK